MSKDKKVNEKSDATTEDSKNMNNVATNNTGSQDEKEGDPTIVIEESENSNENDKSKQYASINPDNDSDKDMIETQQDPINGKDATTTSDIFGGPGLAERPDYLDNSSTASASYEGFGSNVDNSGIISNVLINAIPVADRQAYGRRSVPEEQQALDASFYVSSLLNAKTFTDTANVRYNKDIANSQYVQQITPNINLMTNKLANVSLGNNVAITPMEIEDFDSGHPQSVLSQSLYNDYHSQTVGPELAVIINKFNPLGYTPNEDWVNGPATLFQSQVRRAMDIRGEINSRVRNVVIQPGNPVTPTQHITKLNVDNHIEYTPIRGHRTGNITTTIELDHHDDLDFDINTFVPKKALEHEVATKKIVTNQISQTNANYNHRLHGIIQPEEIMTPINALADLGTFIKVINKSIVEAMQFKGILAAKAGLIFANNIAMEVKSNGAFHTSMFNLRRLDMLVSQLPKYTNVAKLEQYSRASLMNKKPWSDATNPIITSAFYYSRNTSLNRMAALGGNHTPTYEYNPNPLVSMINIPQGDWLSDMFAQFRNQLIVNKARALPYLNTLRQPDLYDDNARPDILISKQYITGFMFNYFVHAGQIADWLEARINLIAPYLRLLKTEGYLNGQSFYAYDIYSNDIIEKTMTGDFRRTVLKDVKYERDVAIYYKFREFYESLYSDQFTVNAVYPTYGFRPKIGYGFTGHTNNLDLHAHRNPLYLRVGVPVYDSNWIYERPTLGEVLDCGYHPALSIRGAHNDLMGAATSQRLFDRVPHRDEYRAWDQTIEPMFIPEGNWPGSSNLLDGFQSYIELGLEDGNHTRVSVEQRVGAILYSSNYIDAFIKTTSLINVPLVRPTAGSAWGPAMGYADSHQRYTIYGFHNIDHLGMLRRDADRNNSYRFGTLQYYDLRLRQRLGLPFSIFFDGNDNKRYPITGNEYFLHRVAVSDHDLWGEYAAYLDQYQNNILSPVLTSEFLQPKEITVV